MAARKLPQARPHVLLQGKPRRLTETRFHDGKTVLAVAAVEFWQALLQRGAPREVRFLSPTDQQRARQLGHIFWLEVVSDGFGSGDVLFYKASPEDDLLDRGSDAQHRRWAFTLGFPFDSSWSERLRGNPWERYSEVPGLP